MSKRDYYEVLGLSKGATKQEIKKSYRTLAKSLHPDRNKAADAEEKFKEVQEAYEVLSDDNKRDAYDKYGFAGTQGFGGAGSGFGGFTDFGDLGDLSDLFGSFFGGSFGGFDFGNRTQRGNGLRGGDIELSLSLDFHTAIFGGEQTLKYKRLVACSECNGTGAQNGEMTTCDECEGKGQVVSVRRTIIGAMQTVTTCPKCHGTGKVAKVKCGKCAGEGREDGVEEFKINIPPGIPDNVTLKFSGRGHAGKSGGAPGDLFISIEVQSDERLERRGDDIYLDLEVDVVTATLGGEVEIPTVNGQVTIKIPSGTQPEKVLKLSGKGGPRFKGRGNGDQYVRILVKVPERLSREQKRLWEELKKVK